jgi:hypothetical protein
MRRSIIKSESHVYPEDVNTLTIGKHFFYLQAKYSIEYIYDTDPTRELLIDLKERGADLFTFIQRSFIRRGQEYSFPSEDESISLLKINSFDDWWRVQINKKVRNMVRKAGKKGIKVKLAKINENFIKSAQRIYNETPIRQGRRYIGYGLSLVAVRNKFKNLQKSEVLGAYYNDELIGLLWIAYGDRAARIRSFVSLVKHRDKAPNNALMAEAVKRCLERDFHFLVYEKMGYLPGLDSFKEQNGFKRCTIKRYYVPLSKKGTLAIKLGVHKEIQYSLPPKIGRALLPMYSFISRAIPSIIWRRVAK